MNVLIFGATGLIGNLLLNECIQNQLIKQVKIFVRKPINIKNDKLIQVICDFKSLENVSNEIFGDVLFNCLGTTLKVAGSQEAQYEIDCKYPVKVAHIASKNGVKCMVNVSSVGASLSRNFYLNTKAQMELGVTTAIGTHSYFLRPSFLEGKRVEFRIGEKIGIWFFVLLNPILVGGMRKYKSINALNVAKAMINIANQKPKETVFEYDSIMNYAQ